MGTKGFSLHAGSSVKIKNVTLKNPIIIASGTPTYGPTNVKKCIKSDAAAFVTKTLCYTEWLQKQPRPRWHVEHPEAIEERGLFFPLLHRAPQPYPSRGVRPQKDERVCQGGP